MWLSNSALRGVGHCCTKSASHPPRPTPSRDPLSPLKYTASALEVPTNALAPLRKSTAHRLLGDGYASAEPAADLERSSGYFVRRSTTRILRRPTSSL